MIEFGATLASLFLLLWAFASCPQRMACPRGWWMPDGVRDSGAFTCKPVPVGGEYRDARGVVHDLSVQIPGELHAQVYCGGRSRPVIDNDGRTVECRVP